MKKKRLSCGTHGTSLSTIINYYDKTFNYECFNKIVNIMPIIEKIEFENKQFKSREEIRIGNF
jgi:2,3-bisphosphoglycerate-dependent phosphoglycerate mutase